MIPIIYREEGLYHARFEEHPKTMKDRSLPRLVARIERWISEQEAISLVLVEEEAA